MSEEKQEGYVVLYDTNGGGLESCSWGLWVCWGQKELEDEIARVLNELGEEYDESNIVILKIDESFKINKTTEVISEEITRVSLNKV